MPTVVVLNKKGKPQYALKPESKGGKKKRNKKGKGKSRTMDVVHVTRAPKRVNKKQMSAADRRMFALMVNSKDQRAWGAKFPNQAAIYTTTCCVRRKLKFTTGGTNGPVTTFIIFPNSFMISVIADNQNGAAGTIAAVTGGTGFSSNAGVITLDSPATYATSSGRRLVAGDVDLRSLQNVNLVGADIVVAPLVITGVGPPQAVLNSVAMNSTSGMDGLIAAYFGNSATGPTFRQLLTSGGLISLPGAKELTTYDLLENSIKLRFMPNSAYAETFRPLGDSAVSTMDMFATGATQGDWLNVVTSTGVVTTTGNNDSMDMRGWNAWVVQVSQSLQNTDVLSIDVALHYELQPMPFNLPGQGLTMGPTDTSAKEAEPERMSFDLLVERMEALIPLAQMFKAATNVESVGRMAAIASGIRTLMN